MSTDLKKKVSALPDDWKGYTLDELRYRRAYVGACCELEKERLLHDMAVVKNGTVGAASNVAKRVSGSIPALNYAMIAFNIGSKVWRSLKKMRRKKKNKE